MMNEVDKRALYGNIVLNCIYTYSTAGHKHEMFRNIVRGSIVLASYSDIRNCVPSKSSETKSTLAGVAAGTLEVFFTKLVPNHIIEKRPISITQTSFSFGRAGIYYGIFFPSSEFYQQCLTGLFPSGSVIAAVGNSIGAGAGAGTIAVIGSRLVGFLSQSAPKGILFRGTLWGALLNTARNSDLIWEKIKG